MEKIIGYTTVDQKNSAQYLSDVELAKRDLANHFAIRKGEKWTNPEFGSNLPLYVFQPLDNVTIDLIEEDVNQVVSYDPRFDLRDQSVQVDYDGSSVTVLIKLMYIPTVTPTELELKFDDEFNQDTDF